MSNEIVSAIGSSVSKPFKKIEFTFRKTVFNGAPDDKISKVSFWKLSFRFYVEAELPRF
jgi:hypothetical protein